MGGLSICRKPVIPPETSLVGEWILNQKSKHFHIGSGQFRSKKGTNLLGVGLSQNLNDDSVCRLIIHEDGMISYYQYTPESWAVIDGPVYSWKNGKIKAYGRSVLNYSID